MLDCRDFPVRVPVQSGVSLVSEQVVDFGLLAGLIDLPAL